MSPARMEKLESGLRTALVHIKAYDRQDVPGVLLPLSEDCVFEEPDSTQERRCLHGSEMIITRTGMSLSVLYISEAIVSSKITNAQ